jgi:D-tyrosyl-tRNA(Tyr) deacylase
MRAVVQRVSEAATIVDAAVVGQVGPGLLVYLGVAVDDTEADAAALADKVAHLRIFPDEQARMNLDVIEAGGAVLVVSAFTTQADARNGRRPTFETAAQGITARPLYEQFCYLLRNFGLRVETGSFGATMEVRSVNAGPVCILLDSKRAF